MYSKLSKTEDRIYLQPVVLQLLNQIHLDTEVLYQPS